jgi:hypothetical protein
MKPCATTHWMLMTLGLADAPGSLKAVLAEAPPDAACPECRQQGIFEGALLMKKLAGAINRRCDAVKGAMHTCSSACRPARCAHCPNEQCIANNIWCNLAQVQGCCGESMKAALDSLCRYPQEMRQHAKEASQKRSAGQRPPWYDKAQTLMAPFAAGL